jgi:putative hydrolase of the HAD superfamily
MIKLIAFDFADTLAILTPSKDLVVKNFIDENSGVTVPVARINECYHYLSNILFYSSIESSSAENRVSFYHRFNKELFKLLGVNHLVNAEDFYGYIQTNKKHWVLKRGVVDLLTELRNSGYLISLVSNFDDCLKEILVDLGVCSFFDSIHVSQTEGIEKPNKRFLELPLSSLKVSPENALFIGDSYHLDFEPSKSIGYHSVLLDEKNKYLHLGHLNRLSNVTELPSLINMLN